jgi:hypothetical protein
MNVVDGILRFLIFIHGFSKLQRGQNHLTYDFLTINTVYLMIVEDLKKYLQREHTDNK